jgi:hypothetical protein
MTHRDFRVPIDHLGAQVRSALARAALVAVGGDLVWDDRRDWPADPRPDRRIPTPTRVIGAPGQQVDRRSSVPGRIRQTPDPGCRANYVLRGAVEVAAVVLCAAARATGS